MPDVITDNLIIRSLGMALVQFVWLGAIVGLLTAALLGLLHRRAAAVRYLVATGGLLTMFLIPVASTIEHTHRLSAVPLSAASTTASPTPSTAQPQTWRPPFMSIVRRSLDSWVPIAVLV
ncbi:MAG: hypothetical protein CL477_16525 [Acidobacteria bacterium]|nr:hypothetical protein [Acidobacteriota bacterium]